MEKVPTHMQLFYGYMGGSMGEIAAAALILGGIYMIWRKIITWHIPVTILLTVAASPASSGLADPTKYADPLFHLLTGG
jgi:Na+-translocating ferredoxin:NAD+ oxidoreductase subunit D